MAPAAGAPAEADEEAGRLLGAQPPAKTVSYRQAPPQRLAPCSIVRVGGTFMVLIVFALIGLSYIPMVYLYSDGSISGRATLLGLHVLLVPAVAAYLQTVFTDPGTVPPEWHQKISKLRHAPYRRCHKSNMFKPPRAHFDSVTRRLVLNMDHYCPWVNNCVGYFNRKFFIQFVFYTSLSSMYAAFFLSQHMGLYLSSDRRSSPALNSSKPMSTEYAQQQQHVRHSRGVKVDLPFLGDTNMSIMILMGTIVDFIFSFALFIFAVAHVWMAARNMSTIEGTNLSRPYRLDKWRNLEQVFGTNRLYWFLPLYGDGPAGDGVHWQLADGTWDGLAVEVEPLDNFRTDDDDHQVTMPREDQAGATELASLPIQVGKEVPDRHHTVSPAQLRKSD